MEVKPQKISHYIDFNNVYFWRCFWLTRDALVWQKIPGLNRLAQTKILDVNDPSTQFRLITWKLSWNAFKEKPIFGWARKIISSLTRNITIRNMRFMANRGLTGLTIKFLMF